MSVEQEGDVESVAHEERPVKSDNSYESICRRIVGKCSFLLLAVHPAVRGENALHMLSNSQRSKLKWMPLFSERYIMISDAVLFQL